MLIIFSLSGCKISWINTQNENKVELNLYIEKVGEISKLWLKRALRSVRSVLK
jgi:hypothetical protein